MLSDMLQSPQPLSQIPICPKPKVKLGPTNLNYPVPPSPFDIATARNPSIFGLTDRDLGLTEMGLQTLCFPSYHFGPTEMSDRSHQVRNANSLFPFRNVSVSPNEWIGPTEFAWPTLCLPITEIGPTEFMWSVSARLCYALTLMKLFPSSWHVGPTKNPNVHILN